MRRWWADGIDLIRADLEYHADWMEAAYRPIADATRPQLDVVVDALADPSVPANAPAWLEPLAPCLRFRFGPAGS